MHLFMLGETKMTSRFSAKRNELIRLSDSFFDVIGLRPVGIAVFATSTILFFYLIGLSAGTIHADGVAVAGRVDHPAPVSSFVIRVFVKPGDRAEVGMPLVELSPVGIDQDLTTTDFEIGRLKGRLGLADVGSSETVAPGDLKHKIGLEARIEMLRIKRARLLESRAALTIKANFAGIVSEVTWLGASISERASVASVMPEFAEEIIVYVPATSDASAIANGATTYMTSAVSPECRAPGKVRTRGAKVEQAPSQLRQFLGNAVHGMPVHITIPRDCRLVNGQVLALNFRNEVISR
jgi:hypothetical protein